MPMTPPVAAQALISSSGILRGCACTRVAIRVGENDRSVDVLHHLHGRPPARVRAARDHSDAHHLVEHLAAEGSQAAVLVLATAADGVVEVVGHQHPFHAERMEELDHAQLLAERAGPFQVEADAEPAAALGFVDVGEAAAPAGNDRDAAARSGESAPARARFCSKLVRSKPTFSVTTVSPDCRQRSSCGRNESSARSGMQAWLSQTTASVHQARSGLLTGRL